MSIRCLFFSVLFFILFPLNALSFGSEAKEVEIIAIGVADGKSSRARDEALNDALRKAVEQGVGTSVTTELTVEQQRLVEDRIYTESRGYIQRYKILEEKIKKGLYEIKISATVKMSKLSKDLKSIGLLLRKKKDPRIMVVVYSKESDGSFIGIAVEGSRIAENQVEAVLIKKGFKLVDAGQTKRKKELETLLLHEDSSKAGQIAKDFGADILIEGEVNRTFAGIRQIYGRASRFFSNEIRLKAMETDTGRIIFSGYKTRPASAADALFFLEEATTELCEETVAGILEKWRKDVFQEGAFQLNFSKISFTNLSKLKAALKKIRGMRDVQVRSFQGGHALLEVKYQGSLDQLADKLNGIQDPPLQVTGMQANTIEIQLSK